MPLTDESLREILQQLTDRHRLPGAVAAIWQDGRYAEAATGVRNVTTGDAMTPDTSFITGSVTKIWTTTVLMTLVDDGVIDLDTPLVEYAPDIQFGADPDIAGSLTARHLVNHSSGIDTGDLFVASREYPEGVEDYLEPVSRAANMTPPGKWASYNNIGWIVLELVLRRVTGRTYHQLLAERVLEPLGVDRSVVSLAQAVLHRTTVGSFPTGPGHHESTPQLLYPSAWSAAGTTLITTVADTVTFLRTHLARGQAPDGTALISQASADAMQTPTIGFPTGDTTGFGLGWKYTELDAPRVLHHGGTSIGGRTFVVVSPADNLVLAAHVNSSAGQLLHDDLARAVLRHGSDPAAEPPIAVNDTAAVDAEAFVGSYRRRGQRVDIAGGPDVLMVTSTPQNEDRIGSAIPQTSKVSTVPARPLGPAALRTTGTGPYQSPSRLTFHEPGNGGYGLLFWGNRLSRRTTPEA